MAPLFGFIATLIAPILINKFGVNFVSEIGIWPQLIQLILDVFLFIFLHQFGYLIYLFLILVITSRMSLWTFYLAHVQIMQTEVPNDQRGTINGVEGSMTNLATMVSIDMNQFFFFF